MSAVSHIFICLFVTLYSLLCWVICPGLVFSSRTPYDIVSAVIVAQDEARATIVWFELLKRNSYLVSVTQVAEMAIGEARRECWCCPNDQSMIEN
jgi:hypothetical protein